MLADRILARQQDVIVSSCINKMEVRGDSNLKELWVTSI